MVTLYLIKCLLLTQNLTPGRSGQNLVWCGRDLKGRGSAGNILSQTLIFMSFQGSRLRTHPQNFHACFWHSAGQSQPLLPAFFQGIGGPVTEWWNRARRGAGSLRSMLSLLSMYSIPLLTTPAAQRLRKGGGGDRQRYCCQKPEENIRNRKA